jgi:NifU-like protein
MWNYSEKVKDHFFNPRNAKVLAQANAIGDVGSLSCGDALRLMLEVDPESERILDAGFQTFGCGSAIASSSALTELVIGKTLAEASRISNQDIADYLDGLPAEKMHCSVMGCEALEAAIANYRGEIWQESHTESALICKCFAVDEAKIVRAVTENQLTTLEQILNYTKAGGGCGACHEKIEQVLLKTLARHAALSSPCAANASLATTAADHAASLTHGANSSQKPDAHAKPEPHGEQEQRILSALRQIRPRLQADGGDVELVAFRGDRVVVSLSGNCLGCAMTDMTLSWVQQQLTQALGRPIQVSQLLQPETLTF